jgi:hypothetical protein
MLEQRSLQNGRQRLLLASTDGLLQRGQGTVLTPLLKSR